MVQYFLDWDPIEEDANADVKKKNRRMLLFNQFFTSNYLYLVGWYYLIDVGSIFPTSFEFFTYFLVFLNQSYVLSSIKIIDKFIAEIIDAQISFCTTVNLQKNQLFRTRVHKLILFQYILKMLSLGSSIIIVWALYDGDSMGKFPWTHLIFLTYPPLTNFFNLMIQERSLQSKLIECKVFALEKQENNIAHHNIPDALESLVYLVNKDILSKDMSNHKWDSNHVEISDFDEFKISKIQHEFILNLFIDMLQVLNFMLLLCVKGLNVNLFSHVAIGKTLVSSYLKLYNDINKKLQFNRFMDNLEKDFPMIKFVIAEYEQEILLETMIKKCVRQFEDCAICQD